MKDVVVVCLEEGEGTPECMAGNCSKLEVIQMGEGREGGRRVCEYGRILLCVWCMIRTVWDLVIYEPRIRWMTRLRIGAETD